MTTRTVNKTASTMVSMIVELRRREYVGCSGMSTPVNNDGKRIVCRTGENATTTSGSGAKIGVCNE